MKKPLLLVISLVIAALAVVYVPRLKVLATVGAGYTAKQICSCLYVSGRSEDVCKKEPEPPADTLVRWTAENGRVHASTLGVAHASARYEEGFGCTIEPQSSF